MGETLDRFNGYSDPSTVCWIWEGRGSGRAERSSKTRGRGKKRAVTCAGECGGGEKGKVKLEWFMGKANWDRVKKDKYM